MKTYSQGLIGMDVKPHRNRRVRKNKFRATHTRWLFPALIALVSILLFIGIR